MHHVRAKPFGAAYRCKSGAYSTGVHAALVTKAEQHMVLLYLQSCTNTKSSCLCCDEACDDTLLAPFARAVASRIVCLTACCTACTWAVGATNCATRRPNCIKNSSEGLICKVPPVQVVTKVVRSAHTTAVLTALGTCSLYAASCAGTA